jgi:hypothetical protein
MLVALKAIPEAQKAAARGGVEAALGVTPPEVPDLFLTWDQIRELVDNGGACQSHTVHHPILTRIPLKEVRRELAVARTGWRRRPAPGDGAGISQWPARRL